MSDLLKRVHGPADLRGLSAEELAALSGEIRDLIVQTVSRTGGHLGPNLGAVELTLALHRVFDSPNEPILFDVGHQSYVHKILTGRAEQMSSLRQTGGLSGYPSRAESPHDWIENSHASTALSYADGLSKAYDVRGERRPVVAVVGDGALTGGMCWEALNNIAASRRPVVIVVNDNGRSYAPTIGGLAERLSGLRLRPTYERILDTVKDGLPKVPVVGQSLYEALHGVKRGVKDMLAPQGLFEDLGLKYFGPVDGHDLGALEHAFTLARNFDAPVIVHCVTQKGYGYAPAENDEADQMHQSSGFDPSTGVAPASTTRRWTSVFSEELVRLGHQRDDIVAITAAMCEPTGLGAFSREFPERFYDVGIAEQHAVASAAGLASAGLHPVVAIYATFLNRAFDQLLMDVALHRLPVTVVLDRAGITGEDGPSHNGVWDLAILGLIPGLRVAAPRDEQTLRDALAVAVEITDGPSVLRFPKTPLPTPIPTLRRAYGLDVIAESGPDDVDVLIFSVGSMATDVLEAVQRVSHAGYSYRVIDPGWVLPVPPAAVDCARSAKLVVTVEDGAVSGGIGSQITRIVHESGISAQTREVGVPREFPIHGKVSDVRSAVGLNPQSIGRRIVEWAALVVSGNEQRADRPSPMDSDESLQRGRGADGVSGE